MQLDAILEVAIGLVFVWLVISVATMETQNRIAILLGWRADHLERAVLSMFKDPKLVKKFYEHPLIMELAPKDKDGKLMKTRKGKIRRTDYVSNTTFARVACEIMMSAGKNENIPLETMSLEQMKDGAKALAQTNPNLHQINAYLMPRMDKVVDNIDDKIAEYRHNTENWFNDVMGQASNWYKVRAQWMAFWIGLVVAVVLNVDTINIAQKLWQEPSTRAVLVAQAEQEVQKDGSSDALTKAQSLSFPVGWTTTKLDIPSCNLVGVINYQFVVRSGGECRALTGIPALNNGWGIIVKLFGYLLSAAAAAQGAPFWFDILKKLVGAKQQVSPSTSK